jgi:proton glutamate symport protein
MPSSPSALRSLAALAAGLAAGTLIAHSDAPRWLQAASAIAPVGTLWVNAIRMTVIPLVVSLLVVSVGSGSIAGSDGRRVGARAFGVFLLIICSTAVVGVLLAPPLFRSLAVDPAAAASLRESTRGDAGPLAAPLPTLVEWVVSLVPANAVKAAADGAMLPLVVFSLVFAAAIARAGGEGGRQVVRTFQGIADAMLVVVRWVLHLAPLGVFALALTLGTRLGAGAAGALGYFLAVHCGLLVVALVPLYAIARALGGVPVLRFARAALPAQAVAVATRSSLATLPAMMDVAERALALPRERSGLALSLAVSVSKPSTGVSMLVSALFVARLYGVELGVPAIATIMLSAIALSFCTPGIPNGGPLVLAPVFAAVGLPVEAVGLLIALDPIPDVFKTVANVTGNLAAATAIAPASEARATAVGAEARPSLLAEPLGSG